jgi:Protein of unknown function (DUF3302)
MCLYFRVLGAASTSPAFGLVVFGLIGIWGIPYEIAMRRIHPHQDAIGAATWVSLFTLGALWPLAINCPPARRHRLLSTAITASCRCHPAYFVTNEELDELRHLIGGSHEDISGEIGGLVTRNGCTARWGKRPSDHRNGQYPV